MSYYILIKILASFQKFDIFLLIYIKIIVFLAIILIAIIGIKVYAETAEEKIIKNEESLVRMTAQLSRGAATSNKVETSTLSSELNKYAGNGATTVSEKSSDTLLVTFAGTGNEYEINYIVPSDKL